jgi:hypothetical protein
MSRTWGWKRGVAWILVAVCGLTGASLHHHELLAGQEDGPVGGQAQVVTSHSPFSSGSHCHRVVRFTDDHCLACQSQRTAALVPTAAALLGTVIADFAATPFVSRTPTRFSVTSSPRAPPVLL